MPRPTATPIEAIKAAGSEDSANICRIAVEREATGIVVGLPIALDGSQGPAARSLEQKQRAGRLRRKEETKGAPDSLPASVR